MNDLEKRLTELKRMLERAEERLKILEAFHHWTTTDFCFRLGEHHGELLKRLLALEERISRMEEQK